ncbi:VOC family protein [Oceaniglobus ichthyenteri]|uniref:VOC family protein n=1 Tax=Oceaniglobus ichthyenteri TaxID=2136177 RepID=UPI000D343F82|nr:VOC family protein [Oceaniglobus ichthyenteri]
MKLDHLAIAATVLEDGVAFVEAAFGVTMAPGGAHGAMGTHNRLLSLGPDLYLEVIAIDPAGRDPGRPRWFDLDRFVGLPRLSNWIVACDDLRAGLAAAPEGTGEVVELQRGDLTWSMAVPASGVLPYDGVAPALIQWHGGAHPAPRLPDVGCRLIALEVVHPEGAALAAHFPDMDGPVSIAIGPTPGLRATFETPKGRVTLA